MVDTCSIRKIAVTAKPGETKLQEAGEIKFRQSTPEKPLLGGVTISVQSLQKILRLAPDSTFLSFTGGTGQ